MAAADSNQLWLAQAPDGAWAVAVKAGLPGAVAVACLAKDVRAGLAERGVGEAAIDALLDRTEAQLRREALAWLPLAKKAGLLITGFEKVQAALKKGDAALSIQASDAGADGLAKLARFTQALPSVRLFSATELGAALGRDQAVHLVMGQGGVAQSFLRSCQRLAGFRGKVGL